MFVDFLLSSIGEHIYDDAFILKDNIYSYQDLLKQYNFFSLFIKDNHVPANAVVALEGDFSPYSTACLLALIENSNIIVPLTKALGEKKDEFCQIAEVEYYIKIDDEGSIDLSKKTGSGKHELYNILRERNHPGIVFFSSGSTGASKGAVHDLVYILDKFKIPRKTKRMITFLMFDHMGGLNTLLHNLSGGGCVITVRDRSPEAVLSIVEK